MDGSSGHGVGSALRLGTRGLCQDIVELRRGDHSGARLKMEQDRLEGGQDHG